MPQPAKNITPNPLSARKPGLPLSYIDTQTIYCGDNLAQLEKRPDRCVDPIYIDPPFNGNRDYEVFWAEAKERRAVEDRHESTRAYIDFMRPRRVALARVLRKTGSFYCHCDWHASHYVKGMLDQIPAEDLFQSEIIWKRTTRRGNVGRNCGSVTDSICFYTQSKNYTWNQRHRPFTVE